MSGIEIALLIIGFAVCIASFLFFNKMDGPTVTKESQAELTEKQKASIERQIVDIFDEKMETLEAKQQSEADMILVAKKREMEEYSETILAEINRNHNEVMFLYDMLNEKKKELNNTVRDVNAASKKAMVAAGSTQTGISEPQTAALSKESAVPSQNTLDHAKGAMATPNVQSVKERLIEEDGEDVLPPIVNTYKTNTKDSAKTAASRLKDAVTRESSRQNVVRNSASHKAQILALYKEGRSVVDIAKELSVGVGEVKLVIDLNKGGHA